MKRFLKWGIITIALVTLFLFLGTNNDEIAEGEKNPMITIQKQRYDENENILYVAVTLNSGFTIKGYSMSLDYSDEVDNIMISAYSDEVSIPAKEHSVGGGVITISSGEKDDEVTINKNSIICLIALELNENVTCEEDIPEDILSFSDQIIYYDGDTYENYEEDEYMVINPMSISVTSITLTDSEFDYTTDTNEDEAKDSYKYGENINLIGGTVTITYDNETSRTARLRKDAIDEKYKWFEIKNNTETGKIIRGITTELGVYQSEQGARKGTQNVWIKYKEQKSNHVQAKVVDYITDIEIEPKTNYSYGENFDTENSTVKIKWASNENNPEEKAFSEMINNNRATISGTSLTGEAHGIKEQEMWIQFNCEDYIEKKDFTVTIIDKIEEITLTNPSKNKYKFGDKELDLTDGTINIQWKSGTENKSLNMLNPQPNAGENFTIKENVLLQGLRTAINDKDSVIVSGFNSNKPGTNQITLTYHYTDHNKENKTVNLSYNIEIVDYVERIVVNPKLDYLYEENFDTENSTVNIKWASKSENEIIEKTLQNFIEEKIGTVEIVGFDSRAENIKKSLNGVKQSIRLTLTYGKEGEINYYNATTEPFDVTIKDKIEEITLTEPIKNKYKVGETALDLTGGKIKLKWLSEETDERALNEIAIREGSNAITNNNVKTSQLDDSILVTGFDSTSPAENQIINLEYHYTDHNKDNKTVNLSYNIEIVDYVERIVVNPKLDYLYGENFDTENSTVNIKWASKSENETIEKTLQNFIEEEKGTAEIEGFDSRAENIKKSLNGVKQSIRLTLTYGKEGEINYYNATTEPFDVTIKDKIEEVTFEEGTIKKEYEYEDTALDLTGGKIKLKWLSEETDERALNEIAIREGSSAITNNNVKTSQLDDSILVTGFNSEQYGEQPITIKYYYAGETDPKEFNYNIRRYPGIRSIDLNKNEITIPYDQVITDKYLEENEYKIIITNTDDTQRSPIPVKAEWIGEYDKEKVGEKQATTVNYNGTQIPLYITIENGLEKIELTKNIITVQWGEELNFTEDYKVIPIMANGTREEGVPFTSDKVQIEGEYNLKKEGTYEVKVIYEGKKAKFTIIVVDPIKEVKLDDAERDKIQKEYKYNEELNLNDAQLTIVRASGEYKETISKDWTDYDKEKLGKQEITIKYKDDETQEVFTLEKCFEVEVKDYIVDIILVRPSKITYLPKEKLDLTGATVRTISASGKLGDEVPVTEDMISGYTEGILGAQRITVKYVGFEKTFDVIFTAQTGVADTNVYAMVATIIATASLTIFAMLTIIQKEKEHKKKM